MHDLGNLLVVLGALLALLGVLLWSGVGRDWIGRLPGDIHISGEKFSVHVPIVTCLLLSLVVSAVFWLVRRL